MSSATAKDFSLLELDPHEVIKNRVLEALIPYVHGRSSRAHCLTMRPDLVFVLTEHKMFVPDVGIFQRTRLKSQNQKYVVGAPDLAIEVVSPSDTATHLKSKVDIYLQAGAKTVWVVYSHARSVMIHSGDSVRELKGDQIVEDPLLPGFSVPVSRFFDLT